jgi:hypothetical protein
MRHPATEVIVVVFTVVPFPLIHHAAFMVLRELPLKVFYVSLKVSSSSRSCGHFVGLRGTGESSARWLLFCMFLSNNTCSGTRRILQA